MLGGTTAVLLLGNDAVAVLFWSCGATLPGALGFGGCGTTLCGVLGFGSYGSAPALLVSSWL